jgi:ATPase subunit of ABC transporter with duplicated ATPase domains
MITMTKEFLDSKRPRDPEKAQEFDEEYQNKVGWIMQKKDRARAVMNQKTTSVADIAAVLRIVGQMKSKESEETKALAGTKAGRRRQRAAEKKKKDYEERVAMRVANIERILSKPTQQVKVEVPKDNEEGKNNEVKVLWNDLQDARYAESWPEWVRHGELEQSRDHVMAGQRDPHYITEGTFQEKGAQ